MCESAVADAEPADQFHRDFPDFSDVHALCNDDASRAVDAVALPKCQSGRTGHQCVRANAFHDLSPESEPKHLFTLHDYAQSKCVAGEDCSFFNLEYNWNESSLIDRCWWRTLIDLTIREIRLVALGAYSFNFLYSVDFENDAENLTISASNRIHYNCFESLPTVLYKPSITNY